MTYRAARSLRILSIMTQDNDDRNYRLFDELLPLYENLSALVIPKTEIAPHMSAFFYCLETFEQEKGDLNLTLEGFAFASRRRKAHKINQRGLDYCWEMAGRYQGHALWLIVGGSSADMMVLKLRTNRQLITITDKIMHGHGCNKAY